MVHLAWKEISRRRGRSGLAIAGFLMVAFLIAAGLCLGDAIRRAVSEPLKVTGADFVAIKTVTPCAYAEVKRPKDLGAIPTESVSRIAQLDGVLSATGTLTVWAFENGKPTVLTGIVPESLENGPLRQYRDPNREERCCVLEEGRYFNAAEREATVLDSTFAQQHGYRIGDTVPIGPRQFKVVGLLRVADVAVIGGGEAYAPLATAQEMLGEGDVVCYVYGQTESGADLAALQDAIEEIIGEGAQVTTKESLPGQIGRSAAFTAAGSGAFVILILAVGGLLMIRSSLASVRERVVEIGVLRAVGWRKRHVVSLLGWEMALQGALGALPGVVLGYLGGYLICNSLNLSLPDSFNSYPACATTAPALELVLEPRVGLTGVIVTLVLTVALAMSAGLIAGRQAASRPPMESLRQP